MNGTYFGRLTRIYRLTVPDNHRKGKTMTHRIAEITGLDAPVQQQLAAMGIITREQLLEEANSPAQRIILARRLGVSAGQLTEWVNRADLMRLTGVSTEMANLLEECGVDSCKELQHRVAVNLYIKLKAVNDEKHITHHVPSVNQVDEWIRQAIILTTQ